MEFFRIRRDIPFMRHALIFNIVSLLTFLAAVFFLVTRGLNLSIEFTGGTAVEVAYAQAADLPHVRYQRNTLDVEGALARLLDPSLHPRAVIMIGAYAPCAKFISLARREGMRALFVNVSFVGDMLNRALGAAGEGVVVTQVVPPLDAPLPVLREYHAAVPAGEASLVSLEGFLAAKVLVAGLLRAGPQATRERFIDALEAGAPLDLGIGPLPPLSKTRHQISDRVWPTVLHGGRFQALKSWSELRGRAGGGT